MRYLPVVAMAVVCVALLASEAHAYLDAGSGSMLVQLLFGGLAGLLVLVKLYWGRLVEFLGFSRVDLKAEEPADAGDDRR